MSRPTPPSGANPPAQTLTAAGDAIELVPLAQDICSRYRSEFPDEDQRYGPAGQAWCLHDNLYLLAWAIQDARDGTVELGEQVVWLADVLDSRGFPVARLARDLEIAAAVVLDGVPHRTLARDAAARLLAAAAHVHADAS
jgi:hypothetical protein